MDSIAYFAYGSNMLRQRLQHRGVNLLDEGRAASIAGYSLAFNKNSSDGSSKANLMRATGETSWGVLFSVESASLAGLDAAEGAPDHYYRATVTVQTNDGVREAMTYLAQPKMLTEIPDQPWDWYLALILAGAKACPGMPNSWIEKVRKVGQSKPYSRQPPSNSFKEAVKQLEAAGHTKWQELLHNITESKP